MQHDQHFVAGLRLGLKRDVPTHGLKQCSLEAIHTFRRDW